MSKINTERATLDDPKIHDLGRGATQMANQPREGTSPRVVRMPDVLWDTAKAKAAGEGRNISEVVRGLLADYAGLSATEIEAMHGQRGADK